MTTPDWTALRPLHDRLIVERVQEENTTKGGIIIPDMALEPPDIGIVRAAGDGRVLANGEVVPMACKVGDRVMFGKYAGQHVKINDIDYISISEQDIIAIVEDTQEAA